MNKNMRNLLPVITCLVYLCAIVSAQAAEPGSTGVQVAQDDMVFFLPEIGAALVAEGDSLKVLVVMPPENRQKDYQSVDLQKDDVVLMFNGKRLKAITDLKEKFELLKPADKVSLGIKRGKKMMITSFPKADPENLPKQKMMIMTGDPGQAHGDGEAAGGQRVMKWSSDASDTTFPEGAQIQRVMTSSGGNSERVVTISPDQTDGSTAKMTMVGDAGDKVVLFQEAGLLLVEKDGAVVVAGSIQTANKLMGDAVPNEGDIISAFQGKPVTTLDAFKKLYKQAEAGEPLTIDIKSAMGEKSLAFPKAKTE